MWLKSHEDPCTSKEYYSYYRFSSNEIILITLCIINRNEVNLNIFKSTENQRFMGNVIYSQLYKNKWIGNFTLTKAIVAIFFHVQS